MISFKSTKGLWIVIKTKKVSEIIINREESWQDNIYITFKRIKNFTYIYKKYHLLKTN